MPKQIVLMYHDVYEHDTSESGFQNSTALKYKVSAEAFEAQVNAVWKYLDDNGLALDAVEFTFDDGGVSFLTVIAPILEKYGFRGVFFIATGFVGAKGFLDAEQIRELVRRGHRVGPHSHSHPERMSALPVEQIADEWQASQLLLAEVLGNRPEVASIPNGYSSREVLDAMMDAGINEIHTSDPTTRVKIYRKADVKGRYAITDGDGVSAVLAIVSSPFTRFRKGARHKVLEIAKVILGDAYLTIRQMLNK